MEVVVDALGMDEPSHIYRRLKMTEEVRRFGVQGESECCPVN